jgi:hypothetical protein
MKNMNFWGKLKVIYFILFLSLTSCLYSKAQDDIFDKNEELLLKKFSDFISAFKNNDGDYIAKFFLYPIIDKDLIFMLDIIEPNLKFKNISPIDQKKIMSKKFKLILGDDFLKIKKTDLEKLKENRNVLIQIDENTNATLEIYSNKDIKCESNNDNYISFPKQWEMFPITTKILFSITYENGEGGGQHTWAFTLIGGQLFFDFFVFI